MPGARTTGESRRPICCPLLVLRTKNMHIRVSQGAKARNERDSKTPDAKLGRGSSSASSMPCWVSGTSLHAWEDLMASSPLSRGQRECAHTDAAQFRLREMLRLESRGAQCCTRLSTLSTCLQNPPRFSTGAEVRVRWQRRSAQLQQWRQ